MLIYETEELYLASLLLIMCVIGKTLDDRCIWALADKAVKENPLYMKGYFRKKAKEESYWIANLKGLSWCQLVSGIVILLMICYLCYKSLTGNKYQYVELVFEGVACGILLESLILRIYYKSVFISAFRYTENEKKEWLPFRYMVTRIGGTFTKSFSCNGDYDFTEVVKNMLEIMEKKHYKFIKEYDLSDEGKVVFFVCKKSESLLIFPIIYMKEFHEDYMEKCNEIFVDFQKIYKISNKRQKDMNLMVLLYVEEKTLKLTRAFDGQIDQKKRRNRLVAIMDNKSFNAIKSATNMPRSTQYYKMRKELLELLNISENEVRKW